MYEEVKRKVRTQNRNARLENPEWEVVKRTQNNYSAYKEKELCFREKDEKNRRDKNRDTEWYHNLQNIANLGLHQGYTNKQYKHVLSRFISWFNPELTIVTERLTANDCQIPYALTYTRH